MTTNVNTKTILAALSALLLTGIPLIAEENLRGPWVIQEEVYHIEGRTKPSAVVGAIGKAEGLSFTTREDLELFAQDRARKLENLRSFKKSSVGVEWPEDGESRSAKLVVDIEDGASFVPIPFAFYNSNDGIQLGTIMNAPNLAGTLSNLFVMGLYIAPPDDSDAIQWTNPNFFLLTTVSGIDAGPVSLSLAGTAMRMNGKITRRGEEGVKLSSTALSGTVAATRKLTENLSDTLSVRLAGSPDSEVTEVTDPELLAYGPINLSVRLRNELAYEAFDWKGNLRQGWKASVGAEATRTDPRLADLRDDFKVDAEAAFYKVFGTRFNPGARLYAFANTGDADITAGSQIRGIRNGEIAGNQGVFLRTGLQTKLARLGSSEIHLSPLADLFWARIPGDEDYETDAGAAVGGEILVLFDAVKSLPIKLGFAWDTRPESRVVGGNRLEVDFNFSFSY